ncbi:M23 family metallopeptidase [Clostridium aestuarii]|uniref:M23 family metallopeptidase n=1 Tax=Clostridium aestuarii TaxID=338193 RepID=A0ABT4CZ83_9CLOT|nr:M23 family metallopeptidase [Clostridium aestuarii]MCY6484292.1 M23 family metallopeptidase [Clostridium aestuarii]
MGNYNSEYESYYNSIVNQKRNYNYGYYNNSSEKKHKKNILIKRLMQDLCGVLVMLTLVIICKMIVTPQTVAVYKYSKKIVHKSYDCGSVVQKIKDIRFNQNIQDDIVEFIDKVKAGFLGEKTIKEKIKEKFSLPVYSNLIKEKESGIDIQMKSNSNVLASFNGKVKKCGMDDNLRQYILIDHGQGVETKYCNLERIVVNKNDTVKKGDIIAKNSKDNSGEFIHFEILFMGKNMNLEKNIRVKK